MVEAIRDALKDRISKLTWMGDSTKQKAYAKLASIKKKVGYPDKWKDFSSMEIGKESYFQNQVNANLWWHTYEINKLGKPVDRDEWNMFPQRIMLIITRQTMRLYYRPVSLLYPVTGMKNWMMQQYMAMQALLRSVTRSPTF